MMILFVIVSVGAVVKSVAVTLRMAVIVGPRVVIVRLFSPQRWVQ